MLKFDVPPCHIGSNVAHKVRRYKSSVASGPVPDVLELVPNVGKFIPVRVRVAIHTNNKQIRLRRISAFLPATSYGVSSGGLYEETHSLLRDPFLD